VNKSSEQIKEMLSFKVPVVFFDLEMEFPCRQVVQDKAAGVMQAVNHLYQLGHREIRMLFAYWENWRKASRFQGFVNMMKKLGYVNPQERIHLIPCSSKISEDGKTIYDYKGIMDNIKHFLESHSECTAVVCGNDVVAMNVLNVAGKIGLKVPDDLSVVGFDNIYASEFAMPPLTTISQPVKKIVSSAWRMLLDSMENKKNEPEKVIVPSELIIRESTGKAKDKDKF